MEEDVRIIKQTLHTLYEIESITPMLSIVFRADYRGYLAHGKVHPDTVNACPVVLAIFISPRGYITFDSLTM